MYVLTESNGKKCALNGAGGGALNEVVRIRRLLLIFVFFPVKPGFELLV